MCTGLGIPLRWLLALGIGASAVDSLGYLFYSSLSAAIDIDGANGFLTTSWVVAMMEMSAWSYRDRLRPPASRS